MRKESKIKLIAIAILGIAVLVMFNGILGGGEGVDIERELNLSRIENVR